MKIQVDLDGELWAKFKAKVHHEGKTLGSVVPTICEPALRAYLDPPVLTMPELNEENKQLLQKSFEQVVPVTENLTELPPRPEPPPLPTVKRCDLCDQVVDRLFASAGKRVCYTCWRAELTAGQ